MWHKPCRTFHPWCPCIKTRCLLSFVTTPQGAMSQEHLLHEESVTWKIITSSVKIKFGNGWLTSNCCGSGCKKFNSGFQFQFQFQFQGFQFQFHFQFHQFQFQFQFQFRNWNWNWNWAAIPIPELNWPQPWSHGGHTMYSQHSSHGRNNMYPQHRSHHGHILTCGHNVIGGNILQVDNFSGSLQNNAMNIHLDMWESVPKLWRHHVDRPLMRFFTIVMLRARHNRVAWSDRCFGAL